MYCVNHARVRLSCGDIKKPRRLSRGFVLARSSEEILSAWFQLQLYLFCKKIRVAERDCALLGLYEYREQAGIDFLYNA